MLSEVSGNPGWVTCPSCIFTAGFSGLFALKRSSDISSGLDRNLAM